MRIQEEEVKYAGIGHLVVLLFSPGYSIGVTDTATVENRRSGGYIVISEPIFPL